MCCLLPESTCSRESVALSHTLLLFFSIDRSFEFVQYTESCYKHDVKNSSGGGRQTFDPAESLCRAATGAVLCSQSHGSEKLSERNAWEAVRVAYLLPIATVTQTVHHDVVHVLVVRARPIVEFAVRDRDA